MGVLDRRLQWLVFLAVLASSIVYFASSHGVSNHLAMLRAAILKALGAA